MTVDMPEYIVAHVEEGGSIVVHQDDFAPQWPDGMTLKDVEIEQAPDGWHIIFNGMLPDKISTAIRLPLEFTPVGQIRLAWDPSQDSTVNTCTGNPCDSCSFSHGTCSCSHIVAGAGNRCNHTVTHGFSPDPIMLKR